MNINEAVIRIGEIDQRIMKLNAEITAAFKKNEPKESIDKMVASRNDLTLELESRWAVVSARLFVEE